MVTRGTRAGALNKGEQFFEPGVGLFEVVEISGAENYSSGLAVVLMKVAPVGKTKSGIENVWFNHETILHKVI